MANKGIKSLWGYPLIDEKGRSAIDSVRSNLENNFQKKTDDTLGTTDKTVPGAINEIKNNIDTIGDNFTSEQSDTKYDMKYNGKSIGSIGIELEKDQIAGGDGSFNIDLTPYQTKNDDTLTTTNKTIIGGINEIKNDIIGNKDTLTTTNKTNIVSSINEVNAQCKEIENNHNYIYINIKEEKLDSEVDYTQAFVRAISKLEHGGIIIVPRGEFVVNNIVLTKKITIKGCNDGSSIIRQANGSLTNLIAIKNSNDYKCCIENLYLYGNGLDGNDIIHFVNDGLGTADNFVDHFHKLENLTIENAGGNGVYIEGSRENIINNLNIRKCKGNGFYYKNSHDSKISNITVSYCSEGIVLDNASALKMLSNKAFGNKKNGINMINNTNNVLTSCEAQDNAWNGIIINANNCVFNGIMLSNNGKNDGESTTDTDFSEMVLENVYNNIINGYFRSESTSNINQFIKFVTSVKETQIHMSYLTSQTRQINMLKTNDLINCGTSVKINGTEIYNNNIINPDIINSVTNGILDGFTSIESPNITSTKKSNGAKQILILDTNNTTTTSVIGIQKEISIVNAKLVSVGACFVSGGTIDEDVYRVRVETWYDDGTEAMQNELITSYGGSQVINFNNIKLSTETTKIKIFFEIICKTNSLKTYEIIEPKLMIGTLK